MYAFCSSVDVKSEYKEMEKLHRSLKEVAENAVLRKGMQDFLLRMSPSKAVPPKPKFNSQGLAPSRLKKKKSLVPKNQNHFCF